MPPVATGIVLIGSIDPAPDLLPVMNGFGVPSGFAKGPDTVVGFDAAGHRLFAQAFSDKLYNFYVFVELDPARARLLHRLRVLVAGHAIERTATVHGPPAARAQFVGDERVRITWDARAFPRLACRDDAGGSPAPLMLGGTFTAADVRGSELRCDFSDGVKTAYAGVRVPIDRAAK